MFILEIIHMEDSDQQIVVQLEEYLVRKKKLHIILVIAIIKVMEIMVHEYIIAITKLILVKHYYRFQGKGIQTILFAF